MDDNSEFKSTFVPYPEKRHTTAVTTIRAASPQVPHTDLIGRGFVGHEGKQYTCVHGRQRTAERLAKERFPRIIKVVDKETTRRSTLLPAGLLLRLDDLLDNLRLFDEECPKDAKSHDASH